ERSVVAVEPADAGTLVRYVRLCEPCAPNLRQFPTICVTRRFDFDDGRDFRKELRPCRTMETRRASRGVQPAEPRKFQCSWVHAGSVRLWRRIHGAGVANGAVSGE